MELVNKFERGVGFLSGDRAGREPSRASEGHCDNGRTHCGTYDWFWGQDILFSCGARVRAMNSAPPASMIRAILSKSPDLQVAFNLAFKLAVFEAEVVGALIVSHLFSSPRDRSNTPSCKVSLL